MRIRYEEKEGRLGYSYREDDPDVSLTYFASGVVPTNLCGKGERAIRAFVAKSVEEQINADRRKKAPWVAFLKNLNVPISSQHYGVLLKGRVVYADFRLIKIRLDEPKEYRGETPMHFGYASHLAGHHVFDPSEEPPRLSQYAIEGGRTGLTWIYDRIKHQRDHGHVIALAKSLN
jgi:hypothetical protein